MVRLLVYLFVLASSVMYHTIPALHSCCYDDDYAAAAADDDSGGATVDLKTS